MITHVERPKQAGSIEFNKPHLTREFVVSGTLDITEALRYIAGEYPNIEDFTDTEGNESPIFRHRLEAKEEGEGIWTILATYSGSPNQLDVRFNVGTQGTKIFEGFEALDQYDCINGDYLSNGGVWSANDPGDYWVGIPYYGKSINVTDDKVEGVDVEIGKVEITVSKKMRMSTLAATYVTTIMEMTPSVNHKAFSIIWKNQALVFPRGSLLFRGCVMGQNVTDDEVDLAYQFAYSKPTVAPTTIPAVTYSAFLYGLQYGDGDLVTSDGRNYRSAHASNIGNTPDPDSREHWIPLASTTTWLATTTYALNAQAIVDGIAYVSLTAGNIDNYPPDDEDNWSVVDTPRAFTLGASTPIEKEGWTYAWPRYRMTQIDGRMTPQIESLNLVRVYEYANFANLQLQ